MITSTQNEHIRKVIRYMTKSRDRREADVFIVEGIRMNEEIPTDSIVETYVSESFFNENRERNKRFLKMHEGGYEIVSDTVYMKMTGTMTPQGILSVVRQRHYDKIDILGCERALLLILEDIQDPGNLGSIFRSAEGAGVTGIVMSTGTADVYNPKVVRSTMGSIFRLPFVYTDDIEHFVVQAKEYGIHTYAAHLRGSMSYDEADYRQPSAFLIGNEGRGLSDKSAAAAERFILIPMKGQVESLNAAVSASLLSFEAARQRRHEE